MVVLKTLVILTIIILCLPSKSTENFSDDGIEIVYQQKLLQAENFVNIEFLVPFLQLPPSIDIFFEVLSNII